MYSAAGKKNGLPQVVEMKFEMLGEMSVAQFKASEQKVVNVKDMAAIEDGIWASLLKRTKKGVGMYCIMMIFVFTMIFFSQIQFLFCHKHILVSSHFI